MAGLPVLYVFVRTDMNSMNPGKAQAHSGHAANAFVQRYVIGPMKNGDDIVPVVQEWISATPQGFGTQINLKASWSDVMNAVNKADEQGFANGIVIDPTYPYSVDAEIFSLIYPTNHTAQPVVNANGNYTCFRKEATAAYIFGYKEDLFDIVGQFPLHP